MKKTYIFKAIMMMCLMLVSAISFTACEEDALDTDQFAGGPVKLLAYGPNPVARMGELRILGVGLDQVQSVTIPGAGEITSINHVSKEEIRLTVPDNAVIGKIVLNTTTGPIESVTALKYTEPVGFADNCFSATELKPGQTLTISGEYLNLVQQVIFAENIVVDQIINTRKEIKVVVPFEAQTGRVAISFCATEDTIPNQIFSPVELKVTLPSVDEVANLTGKKPGDLITQKGSNLDLVTRLTVAGEEVAWWWTDEDKKDGIGYNLPESTPAQATVSVWPASGVECPIAYIGMIIPTELKATPATEVKAGDKIVITGKDLDVVTSAQFAGSAAAVEVTEQGVTSLTVEVPADAQSGDITLNCKSGATATVAIATAKPVAEAYNPSPVNAGNAVTITGKNLELVAKITFADNLPVSEFIAQSETELTVKVPATAVSGELAVTMKNGEQVTFNSLDINSPVFCFIPEMPNTEEVKAGDMICATVVNGDKLTGVQIDGQDCQFILVGEDQLYIGTPTTAGKNSKLKLISSNGEIEYALSVIPNGEIVTTLWSGASVLSWSGEGQIYLGDDGGQQLIDAGAKAGDILRIKFTPTADDWCIQIWEGHWGGQYDQIQPDNYDLAGNNYYYNIVLTDELLSTFTTAQGWGGIVLVQGQNTIVNALELYQTVASEVTIWEGSETMDWGNNQPYIGSDAGQEFIDAEVKAGMSCHFYLTPSDPAAWRLQIFEGHWGPQYGDFSGDGNEGSTQVDLAATGGKVSIVLTQAMIDAALTQQWWGGIFVIQGQFCTVTKITVE